MARDLFPLRRLRREITQKIYRADFIGVKNSGFLTSKKGKGGGYSLRKKPEEISMGSIIRLIDGPLAPVPCVSVTAYEPCEECKDENACSIKRVMHEVRESIAQILDRTSLRDALLKEQVQGEEYMYYI